MLPQLNRIELSCRHSCVLKIWHARGIKISTIAIFDIAISTISIFNIATYSAKQFSASFVQLLVLVEIN